MNIVNAFWGQKDYEFLEAFLDVLAESYGAGVRPVDFVGAPEVVRDSIDQRLGRRPDGMTGCK